MCRCATIKCANVRYSTKDESTTDGRGKWRMGYLLVLLWKLWREGARLLKWWRQGARLVGAALRLGRQDARLLSAALLLLLLLVWWGARMWGTAAATGKAGVVHY